MDCPLFVIPGKTGGPSSPCSWTLMHSMGLATWPLLFASFSLVLFSCHFDHPQLTPVPSMKPFWGLKLTLCVRHLDWAQVTGEKKNPTMCLPTWYPGPCFCLWGALPFVSMEYLIASYPGKNSDAHCRNHAKSCENVLLISSKLFYLFAYISLHDRGGMGGSFLAYLFIVPSSLPTENLRNSYGRLCLTLYLPVILKQDTSLGAFASRLGSK